MCRQSPAKKPFERARRDLSNCFFAGLGRHIIAAQNNIMFYVKYEKDMTIFYRKAIKNAQKHKKIYENSFV